MNNTIAPYRERLHLGDATFERFNHEDATVAIVYKVTPVVGQPRVLKICERERDYEHELFYLHRFADVIPVPRIIQCVPPEPGLSGAILMEYLPGTLLVDAELTQPLAFEIGVTLARIHCERVAGYGDLLLLNDLNADPRPHFMAKFEEGFDECRNHLPKKLLNRCYDYYEAHIDLLLDADGPCVIHRDFRAGNIIVQNGKLQGIIDWSAARAGFAQEDFCTMEHGGWSLSPATQQAFLAGYATVRPVPNYSTVMPLLRVNRALATIGFTVKRGTWQGECAQLYQHNRLFLESFFE
jgi:Ser/Thr protein kinase RdoA (MazF antagonist)